MAYLTVDKEGQECIHEMKPRMIKEGTNKKSIIPYIIAIIYISLIAIGINIT